MFNLNKVINFEYESKYDNEYDLSQKLTFSTPKIATSNGDIKKRWYVYYSFRDPSTGKLKRMSPIYGGANKYHNKEDRLTILTGHRKILLKLLKLGYNPFEDNIELHNKLNNKEHQKQEVSTPTPIPEPKQEAITQEEVGME